MEKDKQKFKYDPEKRTIIAKPSVTFFDEVKKGDKYKSGREWYKLTSENLVRVYSHINGNEFRSLKATAKILKMSKAKFIKQAIIEKLERENFT